MKSFLLFALVTLSSVCLAHGVHDSGAAKPQKGGVLKSLETIHLELVQIDNELRIYVYNKDSPPKPDATKKYPVSAKVVLPRKKGSKDIKLKAMTSHWVANYDAKGIHRYDFEFSIEQGGHKDKIVFTVEPKK